MANYDLNLEVFVKGKSQDVTNMFERFTTIMENKANLEDADWLRSLVGEELSELENYFMEDFSDDDIVIEKFSGFNYEWDNADINRDQLSMSFTASSKGVDYEADSFLSALRGCFPRVEFYFIPTSYISWGNYLFYYDDSFDENATYSWEEGSDGALVLDACIELENAKKNKWLLSGSASAEKITEAQQEEDEAKIVFRAFDYSYHHLNKEEETLTVSRDSGNDYFFSGEDVTEELLSAVYDRFSDKIKIIDFSDMKSEEQPDLPENIANAVKSGKITLEGYRK